ncbi:hypothetical protein NQ318_000261 [Aromia moschata]|uniref:Peptidase S1 domain-containing protein n=1 Tax=Aromia moschata TaxID=1265417 RepID=A0AAV8YWA6_9CUCU|nr:hypothetical protein NQ318_000261 [Aromia moschata]
MSDYNISDSEDLSSALQNREFWDVSPRRRRGWDDANGSLSGGDPPVSTSIGTSAAPTVFLPRALKRTLVRGPDESDNLGNMAGPGIHTSVLTGLGTTFSSVMRNFAPGQGSFSSSSRAAQSLVNWSAQEASMNPPFQINSREPESRGLGVSLSGRLRLTPPAFGVYPPLAFGCGGPRPWLPRSFTLHPQSPLGEVREISVRFRRAPHAEVRLCIYNGVRLVPRGTPVPASPGGRIIGGHEADIEDYPWTLALLLHYQHYCGAVLIGEDWALTAAHCVDHGFHENLAVRAGSNYKSIGGEIVDIVYVHMHPEYDPESVDYDFAMCHLAVSVRVPGARAVQLAGPNYPIEEGDIAHVTGWGTLEYDGISPDNLHAVELPVLDRRECERIYSERLTERMFCAGPLEGGKDACQGDSGGPVVIDNHLVGLVSWGVPGCATPGFPGVFSYVAFVTEWIYDTLGTPVPDPPEPDPEPEPGPIPDINVRKL